jgi:preprotein translocase subunit SecG
MLLNLFNVIYVLVALAMAILILLQRGAGAQAGSGFGGGASGTVFGARGAATFLSRATAFLAGLFFLLSLGMAAYLGHARLAAKPSDDLGVMSGVVTPAAKTAPAAGDVPSAPSAAPASDKPVAPAIAVPGAAEKAAPAKPGQPDQPEKKQQ